METDNSNHAIIFTSQFNQNDDIYVSEVQASNWTSALLELENCIRAHALFNTARRHLHGRCGTRSTL